jgi:Tfp pilus assembly PilM family ATPase
VKLAQAVRDGVGVRLHRAAVIQRPASWTGEDALATEQPLTSRAEIRAAMECGGFAGRNAVGALPMNICQLRFLNVPPGSDEERRTIIGDELAEDWAERRNTMEFDFWEMESARGEKSADAFNVSVLAASRLWIAQLWRDCRDGGLDCWAVDGAPLAMARAVGLVGGLASGRRVLAVDWGFSNTTLCVVGDQRPLYSRRIHDCTFGRVLEAMTSAFNVSLDEAQHLAETQGLMAMNSGVEPANAPADAQTAASGTIEGSVTTLADPGTQSAITQAAAQPIEELLRQIRRTLQFTEAQRRHLHPAAIWLMGGGASMRNAGPYMAHALGLPVHVWTIDAGPISCASGHRSSVFAGAAALSAAAWRAA